jgi:hypothetical protein
MSSTSKEDLFLRDTESGLFSLVNGDPLGKWISRLAISYRLRAVLIAMMLSFSVAIVALFEGTLVNDEIALGLLHDIG